MAACKPVTFTKITRQKFQAIRARIAAQASSTTNNGDSGTATGATPFGAMVAEWTYSEPSQTLVVTVTKKPMLLSESFMRDKMQALVESINL